MPLHEFPFSYHRPDQRLLRCLRLPSPSSTSPLQVFLSGFRSVHTGHKATAVAAWAAAHGCGCLRFDHLGHGISDGPFENFRIGQEIENAAAAINAVAQPGQPVVIIGSNMGGWIGMEVTRRRLVAVAGLLLIAPAVEFVSRRLEALSTPEQHFLKTRGYVDLPDRFGGVLPDFPRVLAEGSGQRAPPRGAGNPLPGRDFSWDRRRKCPGRGGAAAGGADDGGDPTRDPGGDHRLNLATGVTLVRL